MAFYLVLTFTVVSFDVEGRINFYKAYISSG